MPDQTQNRRIPYFGDFVLFDEVGRGGMGVVYDAQQSSLDRRVALKVLHADVTATDAARQRLRLEAEAAARLEHPYILPIYEVGEHEGRPYLAMQFVEGESLAQRIARLGSEIPEKEAATLLAKVARAVQHAHERGVLHRDLKPGNILVDQAGQPHLIDFGLARCVGQDSGLTRTGAFLGTPAYASPEQAAGQNQAVTTSTDVYSLGAILYALLTGQPPFVGKSAAETIGKVRSTDPVRPRSIRPSLERDLETICLKCIEKEPRRRYGSALALAEDLERFLDGRPILARPVKPLERLWMWTRRKPVHAALAVMAALAVLASLAALVAWRQGRGIEREARHQIRQRHLLTEMQFTRLTPHRAGWSQGAWRGAVEAAAIPTAMRSDDLRNQAAALLAGLDAQMVGEWTNFSASSVLFDREGKRILIGCAGDRTRLLELAGETMQTSPLTNSGPVAFGENGAPLELLFDASSRSLHVVDVLTGRTMREWAVPASIGADRGASDSPVDARPFFTFTPDGLCAAGVFEGLDGRQHGAAFLPDAVRSLMILGAPVSAVAISPDGSLVVAGESRGRVHVWSIRDASRIAEFSASRVEILSLALRQVARHRDSPEGSTSGTWLLAVGDAGGTVTIWDVESQSATAHCVGGHYHITAVAFSPDGTILASGGRGPINLWDVGTGRLLLESQWGDYITDLAFSPDGACLAMSAENKNPPYPAGLAVWRLEFGRGIQTLRGLSGEVSKVCLSPDGRRCAALSHRWEVGVWDVADGRLLRIFETPVGQFADNASLAWSPDGEHLAFASWQAARLWDIASGQTLRRWDEHQLSPGLCDTLAFPDQEHLFLFRVETRDGKRPPLRSIADPKEHPRVCRLRELLKSDPPTLIAEITDFSDHVKEVEAPPDGRCFVVEGRSVFGDEKSAIMKCFDGRTGRELWSRDLRREECGVLVIDAAGKLLTFPRDPLGEALLVELQTGRALDVLDFFPWAIRAEPRLYAGNAFDRDRDIRLFNAPSQAPLLTLAVDPGAASGVRFNAEGNRLAWGNADGTVTVCHLEEMENRLRAASAHFSPGLVQREVDVIERDSHAR